MFDEAATAFRAEIKAFCESNLPDDIRSKVWLNQHLTKEDNLRWQRILHAKGWLTGHWPREFGGLAWTRLQRWLFEDEAYRCGSPWLVPFGVTYVAPVIYTFGSAAQQARWLGPTARSELWWAQGYSEPNAGSDLAHLSCRAERGGDTYIVNGQKVWTTMAGWADMIFVLVRTNPSAKPQHGISFLLVDLRSPGVTVRPIKSIDLDYHLHEVFFEDVRVPGDHLVGQEGAGWTYAKFLLGNERLVSAEIGKARRMMLLLREFLHAIQEGGQTLAADRNWRRRIAELDARTLAVEAVCMELFAQAEAGVDPGAKASVLKILGSELLQAISAATIDALGHAGLSYQRPALDAAWKGDLAAPPGAAGAVREYLHGRAATIYGGSNEIQRNIIAKSVLAL